MVLKEGLLSVMSIWEMRMDVASTSDNSTWSQELKNILCILVKNLPLIYGEKFFFQFNLSWIICLQNILKIFFPFTYQMIFALSNAKLGLFKTSVSPDGKQKIWQSCV